ncbi:nucleotidyltransferase domain-containing protein [Roseisolibacter sp. H3M3-2]|uniref:nucleotidyltransferase domain-containing protein n=1 Tax=Roseisolibacter sp. H3M3-2 TaxID=3031323 RepID=UPI0023DA772D|nr:nucleotidyltransferase domain-containing protein [Roseisolibacter sp. H3M3-2]MDF1504177.1 nucleotidyltransferase domain-containing protein [Roseisolibacter sp. H3M3-2]
MARMTLDELVAQLRAAYGDALRAVVLYGSAAGGDHVPERSDYNVLVVVDGLGMPQLRAVAATARAWAEAGHPPPLTLTAAEWRASADVFPMEYADLLERHRVLHGALPLDGVRVDPRDLRVEVEQQTLGKLLQLRSAIVATGWQPKRQLELLEQSLGTFMAVFRAVLRLHGERPPEDREALAQAVGARAGFDAAPFARVARHVRGASALPAAEATDVLAGYLAGMERLAAHVDALVVPPA